MKSFSDFKVSSNLAADIYFESKGVDNLVKITRNDLEELDNRDPLNQYRSEFNIPEDILYFDGNSLGALPSATVHRVNEVILNEWGSNLINSWNSFFDAIFDH